MSTRSVVIGGGIGGTVAALRLAQAGHEVVLLERGNALGGLVASFSVAGTPLERYYHHTFPHESPIRALIEELGLTPQLQWFPSTVGILTAGRLWPFTSPADLLRFTPLTPLARLHTGAGALRLKRLPYDDSLDAVPARDWLRRYCGASAVDVVWDPLLRAKFGEAAADVPASWMWARFRQRSGARRERGAERLGYLRGGFRQIFEVAMQRLVELDVDVRLGAGVRSIAIDRGSVRGVITEDGEVSADVVIYAGSLPGVVPLVPHDLVDHRWRDAKGLGVVCIVVEMDRPISDIYWTNVCDPAVPFGGIIEHTNLLPPEEYGGRHIAYLSRYTTPGHPIMTTDSHATAASWLDLLDEYHPGFHKSSVTAVHPFVGTYAAPLVHTGYQSTIPPARTHIGGLHLATTAQIYPDDRGMSEGVRLGAEVAAGVLGQPTAPHTDGPGA